MDWWTDDGCIVDWLVGWSGEMDGWAEVGDISCWVDDWAEGCRGLLMLGACSAWVVLEIGEVTLDVDGEVNSLSCIGDGSFSRNVYEGGSEGVIEPKGKMVSSKFT